MSKAFDSALEEFKKAERAFTAAIAEDMLQGTMVLVTDKDGNPLTKEQMVQKILAGDDV